MAEQLTNCHGSVRKGSGGMAAQLKTKVLLTTGQSFDLEESMLDQEIEQLGSYPPRVITFKLPGRRRLFVRQEYLVGLINEDIPIKVFTDEDEAR